MKKRLLTFGMAVLAVAMAGGVLIHALTSRRPPPTKQNSVPEALPPTFGDRTMNAEARHGPPSEPPRPQPDPVAQNLFAPELIMRFQDRIGLSDEQRQTLMADMQRVQPKFQQLQQPVQQEQAALGLLLEQERAELEPILAQADKIQDLEREMRRTQLALRGREEAEVTEGNQRKP